MKPFVQFYLKYILLSKSLKGKIIVFVLWIYPCDYDRSVIVESHDRNGAARRRVGIDLKAHSN